MQQRFQKVRELSEQLSALKILNKYKEVKATAWRSGISDCLIIPSGFPLRGLWGGV